jgi:transcriptional antiterminator NusG
MEERAWYSVQTYSGMENAVKKNIERRIESMNMQEYIFNVLVPEEVRYEKKKNGEMKEVIEKPFSGYVFVDMIVTDETWFMVRNTPMVTGFLGSSGGGAKPVPIPEEEMLPILKMCGAITENPFDCEVGDRVKIVGGTFAGQYGAIDSIDFEKKIVKVLVDFFGRPTPAELEFDEIKKEA